MLAKCIPVENLYWWSCSLLTPTVDALSVEAQSLKGKGNLYLPYHLEKIPSTFKFAYSEI